MRVCINTRSTAHLIYNLGLELYVFNRHGIGAVVEGLVISPSVPIELSRASNHGKVVHESGGESR